MRLVCTGDLHLGASPDFGARPGDRLADQEAVWMRVCGMAVAEQVDAVLFAGDAFHRRRPTPSEIVAFRRGLELLNRNDIDVIAIGGNHDIEAAHLPSGLETTPTHALYEVSRRPEHYLLGSDVVVATLPWTPPSQLIAARGGGDRDELNHDVAQMLVQAAADLREQIPDGKTAILLAHWSVSGASLPTGLATDLLREPVLPLAAVRELGFDAVVLGHIHSGQDLREGPFSQRQAQRPIFYVGSPAAVDWGEAAIAHGCWFLDTEEQPISLVFCAVEDRRFVTLDIDLTPETTEPAPGLDDTDCIASFLGEHLPLTDALVRLRYKATAEQARHIDLAAIQGFCRDAGVAKLIVRPEILRADRARVEGIDESLEPLEALHEWVKANELSHEQAERIGVLTATYLEAA